MLMKPRNLTWGANKQVTIWNGWMQSVGSSLNSNLQSVMIGWKSEVLLISRHYWLSFVTIQSGRTSNNRLSWTGKTLTLKTIRYLNDWSSWKILRTWSGKEETISSGHSFRVLKSGWLELKRVRMRGELPPDVEPFRLAAWDRLSSLQYQQQYTNIRWYKQHPKSSPQTTILRYHTIHTYMCVPYQLWLLSSVQSTDSSSTHLFILRGRMFSFISAWRILLLLPPDRNDARSSSLLPRMTGLFFPEPNLASADIIWESGCFRVFDSLRLPLMLGVETISLKPLPQKQTRFCSV